ncbi:MAG: OmpH family outer membrane protein [Bacteroidales bacterium]|nr:OmpH family outer membrane protein [Bacteroidales bacterium]
MEDMNMNTDSVVEQNLQNVAEQVQEVEQKQQQIKEEQPKKKSSLPLVAIIVSLVAIVLSIVSLVCGKSDKDGEASSTAPAKILQKGDLKIAYVNTDTIMAKYEMAVEMQKEITQKQKQAEQTFQNTQAKFQSDYQDYMKNGDKLTLTQQKEKEKELQNRMQQIQQMQTSLPMQLQEEQLKMNKKLLDAVYAFIADYNKKHDKYNVILSNSYANSPTLYIDKGMDITEEILKGLNEEYKKYKEN